jgi:hypothetical protein
MRALLEIMVVLLVIGLAILFVGVMISGTSAKFSMNPQVEIDFNRTRTASIVLPRPTTPPEPTPPTELTRALVEHLNANSKALATLTETVVKMNQKLDRPPATPTPEEPKGVNLYFY